MTTRRPGGRGTQGQVPPGNSAEWERARLAAGTYPAVTPPIDPHPHPAYEDSRGRASVFSGLNFLAGVWLVLAPFALDYQNTGPGFNGWWNDIILGIAIALLALTRALAPGRIVWISWVNMVLGAWLIVAPFVLAYNTGSNAALTNDITVGIVVLVLALLSSVMTLRERGEGSERSDEEAVHPRQAA